MKKYQTTSISDPFCCSTLNLKVKKPKRNNCMLEKIHRTIRRYGLVSEGDRIFVALSGGKDSGAALAGLVTYAERFGINAEFTAFHIDFGVSGKILETVRSQAEAFKIPLRTVRPEEFGVSIKDLKGPRPICSCCGVIKRYLMNRVPRESGATKVATGHHADDFIVFFFKNVLSQNFSWISKFRPVVEGSGKLLSKIRPLFEVDGKTAKKVCEELSLPFVSEDLCPHSVLRKGSERTRERWYALVDDVEGWCPGFKVRMVRSISRMSEYFREEWTPGECPSCGEPSGRGLCSFCKLVKRGLTGRDGSQRP